MKKLLTVSAVVLLMIFTAGLAAAKAPVSIFPFTGTGDIFSVTDTGVTGGPLSATITVNEVDGLFYGTIVLATLGFEIDFSAVRDSSGVYAFKGQTVSLTASSDVSVAPAVRLAALLTDPVQGAFTISKQKNPALPKHAKEVLAATIGFRTLDPLATSYAGLLFQ
jgi:hypothetical protein